jgi:hypothetical protein
VTKPVPELREDAQFVMNALCQRYSATWEPGEDPPDAYMICGQQKIAVEVSSLVQHMHDGQQPISREGIDQATIKLAPELQAQLGALIPDGFRLHVGLLHTPLRHFSQTKRELLKALREVISRGFNALSAPYSCEFEIRGNPIAVFVDYHGDMSRSKVETYSISGSADLGENTRFILRDRIEDKQKKCQAAFAAGPVWLALFNHYWLTDSETYRYALSCLEITHSFDAIIIVSEHGDVDPIYMSNHAEGMIDPHRLTLD